MTKTRKIALAMFSALLAISVFVSALFGFGVIGNFANAGFSIGLWQHGKL